jgi:hypothetical protein
MCNQLRIEGTALLAISYAILRLSKGKCLCFFGTHQRPAALSFAPNSCHLRAVLALGLTASQMVMSLLLVSTCHPYLASVALFSGNQQKPLYFLST